ncbi:hypothetical protein ACFFTN_21050 [Aminobacter aganoensis]|uniref:Uncharacterized protein n=1 Tax=Aminobacter aganoensis TaxID=83264 RepID=A0A7X0FCQ4_9HYPH|nr:hypothetical protein [Aminobacter aganoensis]MBB6356944.1 hypothetical protein [Aminobacter aganoensis]
MALLSRLERLEQRAQPDPLFRANIKSASGMSEPALAADFSQRLVDGTLPPDLDPIAVSKFVQLIPRGSERQNPVGMTTMEH